MSSNVLSLILNLKNNSITNKVDTKKSNNRINDVGDGFEEYVQRIFLGNLSFSEKNINKIFSYTGNKSNPPDLIIKNGDAIEIKKRQSIGGDLALNSSYPRDKLYSSDPKITDACKNCENNWKVKDIFYIVGHVPNSNRVETIFCVQGNILAAQKNYYEKYITPIKNALKHLNPSITKELGRFNKIDPLERTNLRVRGMFSISSPFKAFDFFEPGDKKNISINILLRESKYNSLPKKDRDKIKKDSQITFKKKSLNCPNDNKKIKCIFLSYKKNI